MKKAALNVPMKRKGEKQQNGIGAQKADAGQKETSKKLLKMDQQKATTSAINTKRKKTTDSLKHLVPPKQDSNCRERATAKANKKSNAEEKSKLKIATQNKGSNGIINPLDNILSEIEAFDTANKKKIKKEYESDDDEVDNMPSSSRHLPPTPVPGSFRPLNKIELARQEHDLSMVQSFLRRDDMMQRILAYKMFRGRVESYAIMRLKIDMDTCIIPDYELKPIDSEATTGITNPELVVKAETPISIDNANLNSNKTTPEQGGHKRGPMTPPGSPGTNKSSTPGPDIGHTEMNLEILPGQSSAEIQKREQGNLALTVDINSPEEIVKNLGSMTGIPADTLKNVLGDDFGKLSKLKMDDLLNTFINSVRKIARDKEIIPESSSSKAMRSPILNSSQMKDEIKSIGSGGFLKSLTMDQQRENTFEMDAMDISSQSMYSSAGDISFSNGLLPPPPAPPPILNPTASADLMVPPPPLPPIIDGTLPPPPAPSSPSHNISVHPMNPTAGFQIESNNDNHFPLNDRNDNFSTDKMDFSNHTEQQLLSDEGSPAKKLVIRSETGIKRGKLAALLKKRPNRFKNNKKYNMRGLRQIATPVSLGESRRPVSLMSLNLTGPSSSTAIPSSANRLNRPNEASFTAISMPVALGRFPPITKETSLGRDVPIVVDMDFIKNTPPPPVPDIIKKNIAVVNDQKVGESMTGPSIPFVLQRIPQPLLNMDLTRIPTGPSHARPPPPAFRPSLPDTSVPPPPVPTHNQPSASSVLQTVVQAIGHGTCPRPPPPVLALKPSPIQRQPPPYHTDPSPYGKFF